MKKKRDYTIILLLCLSFLCLSCEPNEVTDGENQSLENLKTGIIGEWVVNGSSARTTGGLSTIEFLRNGRYVMEERGQTSSDKYQIENASTVSLANLGEIRDVSLTGNELEFRLVTPQGEMGFSAERTAPMENDERMKLLCRRWRLLPVEDAVDSLTMVYKSYVTFSESGSYIFETWGLRDSPMPSIMKYKWKWHPQIENRIQYWYKFWGDGPRMESEHIQIRELTETSLKVSYSTSDWSGSFSHVPEEIETSEK